MRAQADLFYFGFDFFRLRFSVRSVYGAFVYRLSKRGIFRYETC